MKILLIIEASGGGSGRHVVDLAHALIDDGHEVHVIYSPTRAEPGFVAELGNCPQLRVCAIAMKRAPHPADLAAILRIRRYIVKNGGFDVVHGHSSKAGALARLLKLARLRRTRFVYTPHAIRTLDPTLSTLSRWGWLAIEKLFGRLLTDATIAVSPDEFHHIIDTGIVRRDRTHLVINGLTSTPPNRRDQVRARFGIRANEFCLGFVGRLAHQKAPEVMVDAFARLADSFPNLRLVMLGSGPQSESIEHMISQLGLSRRIAIRSNENGFESMFAFDVFVMPSRYEGMPYVLLEAAACGLPIIATDVGGVSAIVAEGQNGLIVPIDDPEQLANAIRRLVANPECRTRMQNVAKRQSNDFSAEKMAMETAGVYAEAANSRSPNIDAERTIAEPTAKPDPQIETASPQHAEGTCAE